MMKTIVCRKTYGPVVYCFVLLFLNIKRCFNLSHVAKVSAQTFSKDHAKTKENGANMYKMMNAWLKNCRSVLVFMKR